MGWVWFYLSSWVKNLLESVLANSDSVEVSVVQKKGAGWRRNGKHVMNVFAV